MGYEMRKLRMKALQSAVANPSPDDGSDNDELILTETTPETSSSDEEPVYDDRPEPSSSMSDEELRSKRQKRERFREEHRVKISFDKDELPTCQNQKYKKRLDFSPKSKTSEVAKKNLQIRIYSPSKCSVVVEGLKQSVANYYLEKMHATKPLLRKMEGFEQASVAELESVQAPHVEQAPRSAPAALILTQETAGYMEETPAGQLTETPAGENEVCVSEPQNQMSLECVVETPAENMPATPAGENNVCVSEPQNQVTCECVDETPTENMPATPAVENEVCVPEPQTQMTPEYVDETLAENMPDTQFWSEDF